MVRYFPQSLFTGVIFDHMWLILIILTCYSVRSFHYLSHPTTGRLWTWCTKDHLQFLLSSMLISFTMYNVCIHWVHKNLIDINDNLISCLIWDSSWKKHMLKVTKDLRPPSPFHSTILLLLLSWWSLFHLFCYPALIAK